MGQSACKCGMNCESALVKSHSRCMLRQVSGSTSTCKEDKRVGKLVVERHKKGLGVVWLTRVCDQPASNQA